MDKQALLENDHVLICLDVWENEPDIQLDLLNRCLIATPHIAGYSLMAKQRATRIMHRNICGVLNITPPPENSMEAQPISITSKNWQSEVLQIFDPLVETEKMKKTLEVGSNICKRFITLRKQYSFRNEFRITPYES